MIDSNQKTVIINNIKLRGCSTSTYNLSLLENLKNTVRVNKSCLYKNIECDKDLIVEHLNKRYELAESITDEIYGKKNLLYFSAFLNDDYIDILNMCLNSIVSNTQLIDFDLLLITDSETKEKISSLSVLSFFNVNYMILPPVEDGPDASMKKLNIFDYENINQYRKILFLDIDSLCVMDLNKIFNQQFASNTLYVSRSEFTRMQTLTLIPFGIMHISDKDANFFYSNRSKIMPFNAGQFFMINSLKMRMHFDNVRWLASAWPGPYFYEQSFMNYYFVFRDLVKLLSSDGVNKLICVVGIYWKGERRNFNFFDFFGDPDGTAGTSGSSGTGETDETSDSSGAARFYNHKLTSELKQKRLIVSGASKSNFTKPPPSDFWNNVNISTEYKFHDENSVVIHFAGFGPGPVAKKKYMIEYINKHNLSV